MQNERSDLVARTLEGESMKSMIRKMALVACIAGAVVGVGSGTALAHQKSVSHTCSSLTVDLVSYNEGATNRVIVSINGTQVTNTVFSVNYATTFTFADPTVNNTYRVVVTASDDPTGAFGWTFDTGTTEACPDAPPPTTSTTTPPTTSTTTPPTSTTSAATTTTAAATTTTTAGAGTTTTSLASGGPVPTPASTSTTAPAATTTTVGGGAAGPTTTAPGVGQGGPVPTSNPLLPATGSSTDGMLQLALISVCVGVLAVLAVRRRTAS